MDKQELKGLIDHMEAAQSEVLDAIEARHGKEYVALVARHGGAIAVLKASNGAFIDHPQSQTIENAINLGIYCVIEVGIAQVLKLQNEPQPVDDKKLREVSDEFQGDLVAFVQQTVKYAKLPEGESN